jgi:signal transduction histidine kinase
MGGQISVNSAVGVGTTFHVYVPLPRDTGANEDTPPSVA